jgi:hypothetical protein
VNTNERVPEEGAPTDDARSLSIDEVLLATSVPIRICELPQELSTWYGLSMVRRRKALEQRVPFRNSHTLGENGNFPISVSY